MTDTIITVRGEHLARFPAEEAVAYAQVRVDGPERAVVVAAASAAASALSASIQPLLNADAGPVTRWIAEQVRVWSQRPWNDQGAQLDLVYYAQLDARAIFTDSEALAGWVEKAGGMDNVQVSGITWRLSDAGQRDAEAGVRTAAVAEAVEKARSYAQALGLASLEPLALADVGLLGDQGATDQRVMFKAMAAPMAASGSGSEFQFSPDDIEVHAAVDARFRAS